MLKVTVHDGSAALRIQVEGKLTAPWVEELEHCWHTAKSAAQGKPMVLDLRDLDYADQAGKYLVKWMHSQGVEVVAKSLPGQEWLRELTGKVVALLALTLMLAQISTAEPLRLTLRKAVEIAVSRDGNARIQLADESVKQAELRSKQARAALLPNVDGYIAYQDQTRNLKAFGFDVKLPIPGVSIPTFVGPFSTIDGRLNASQSVFDFAAIKRYQSSKVAINGVKADRDNTNDQVAAQVARTYLSVLKTAADVEVAQANVELAQAVLKLVEQQKAAGTGVGIEVTRAKVQLANEKQRLLVVRNDRRRAQLNLLRAVGLRLDTEIELDGKLAYKPADVAEESAATKKALGARADYKAQAEKERSAQLSGSATAWERLPSVAAIGDYGAIGTSLNNALPTRTVGIQVRVPVFDGGRRDARRAESASQYRQEQARTRDLKEQIELEVRTALDSLRSAAEQVNVSQEGLQLSEEELASARRRYSAGVATSVEITDAQTRLERARDNQVAALFAFNVARVDLAQAQGVIEEVIE